MTDSILDEFDDGSRGHVYGANLRRRCVAIGLQGRPCQLAGKYLHDDRAYCWAHDPGPEAA